MAGNKLTPSRLLKELGSGAQTWVLAKRLDARTADVRKAMVQLEKAGKVGRKADWNACNSIFWVPASAVQPKAVAP
ncbi:hypothetical protein EOD42_13855 [Rhodovarius crocodyli]|uniref:MarR family transcriptional regulator n=1 Tax=Rhodovarius crocodyli TaxID=1979269 RepID=A0A437MEY5_9PROT|nr:hypothetical protein [Rhodovarius crocodyli]RVT96197.1 hypothetical protein EOD42_13855 [Rhodovarius crocodyli]